MKRTILLPLLLLATTIFAQTPSWLTDKNRAIDYPHEHYLVGFAINAGKNTPQFTDALKASAKTELIEGIQVSVQSEKTHRKSEINGHFNEHYTAVASTFADAEINGLKIEYYYDNTEQTGYAFAYVHRQTLQEYYKAKIAFAIERIESMVEQAERLKTHSNKATAKRHYEEASLQFDELYLLQALLIALGGDDESVRTQKSLALKNEVAMGIIQLQGAITVYVKSDEKNIGQQVNLLQPKLKSLLAQHGCSYTDHPNKADWLLTIQAATRKGHEVEGIFFSFLDITISLIEQRTGKEMYNNSFTGLKGGGLDYEMAGRKAYDGKVQHIADEIFLKLEKR